MTLILFILLACITLPLQCLLNYKVSPDFSNTYWIKSLIPTAALAIAALVEFSYFQSSVFALLFIFAMGYIFLKFLMFASVNLYVYLADKVDSDSIASMKLFFTNMKVRSFYLSKGHSNIYFINNDGVNIYFDKHSADFEPLSNHHVTYFAQSVIDKSFKPIELNKFVILNCDNRFMSVSSEELKTLDVPLEKITKAHFDLLQMVKI